MKLLEMSISAGVLILLLALLRTWNFWNLPKRTIRMLWMVVLARLLLPASLPVQIGVASPALRLLQKMQWLLQNLGRASGKLPSGEMPEAASFGMKAHAADGFGFMPRAICWIWMAGMACFGIYFALSFLKEYRLLAQALPLDTLPECTQDAIQKAYKKAHKTPIKRHQITISECPMNAASDGLSSTPSDCPTNTPSDATTKSGSSAHSRILECYKASSRITGVRLKNGKKQLLVHDRIQSPLVSGTLRQRIVLPKSMLHLEPAQMQHVLAHEMIHIKRRDNLWKLVATAAVCLHWFNPLVWLMYLFFARDLELSCDEEVLALYSSHGRMEYAMTLLTLAQKQKETILFSSGFGKNRTKERIVAIMKFKHLSGVGILCSVMLIAGASSVFATSGKAEDVAKQPALAKAQQLDDKTIVCTFTEPWIGTGQIGKYRLAEVAEGVKSRSVSVTEDAKSGTAGDGKEDAAKSGTEDATAEEVIDISFHADVPDAYISSDPEAEILHFKIDSSEVDLSDIGSEGKTFHFVIDDDNVLHLKNR